MECDLVAFDLGVALDLYWVLDAEHVIGVIGVSGIACQVSKEGVAAGDGDGLGHVDDDEGNIPGIGLNGMDSLSRCVGGLWVVLELTSLSSSVRGVSVCVSENPEAMFFAALFIASCIFCSSILLIQSRVLPMVPKLIMS